MTKHKHHDAIVAWAGGAKIQYRIKDNEQWADLTSLPLWYEYTQYRVKPAHTNIKYRVCLFKSRSEKTLYTCVANNENAASVISHDDRFVEWITDWITKEVYVE